MDNQPQTLYHIRHGIRQAKNVKQQKYLEDSHKRLQRIITKKIQTLFIGILAILEEQIGYLWGHEIPDKNKITADEARMAERWDEIRTLILNHGNNQLRAVMNELDNHIVEWKRYSMNLPFRKGENDE